MKITRISENGERSAQCVGRFFLLNNEEIWNIIEVGSDVRRGRKNDEEKTCFVVTPIGDENAPIRRHIDGIIDQAIFPGYR